MGNTSLRFWIAKECNKYDSYNIGTSHHASSLPVTTQSSGEEQTQDFAQPSLMRAVSIWTTRSDV